MIAVVDYDAGNIRSVERALAHLGQKTAVTRDPEEILGADGVILPGVGAFGDAMEKLHSFGLAEVLRKVAEREIPLLGICLGLQLLFERSQESPGVEGLRILKGEILRIPSGEGLKVPHMGWNSLSFPRESRLFGGLESQAAGEGPYVYFVHSYYLQAAEEGIVTAQTEYGVSIDAAVEKGNVFACQFHPEKSSHVGMGILKNFVECCGEKVPSVLV